jgi:hypothetical protein
MMTNRRSMPAPAEFTQFSTDSGNSTTTTASPVLENFGGDIVRTPANQAVLLDRNLDATVGDVDHNLIRLEATVYVVDNVSSLGIDTNGNGIVVSANGQISIDGTVIGTKVGTVSSRITVNLLDTATPELVTRLVRALTYTYTGEDNAIHRADVGVALYDANNNAVEKSVEVIVVPSATYVLTADEDNLTGTADTDTFFAGSEELNFGDTINGEGGTDTLHLNGGFHTFDLTQITLESIEIIQGSDWSDWIDISGEQLQAVTRIHGGTGANRLDISGTQIDLTGKDVTDFEKIMLISDDAEISIGDKDLAFTVHGYWSQRDHLILIGEELTEGEWLALHRQGVETITAFTDGVEVTSTHGAPEITNLDGDVVSSTGTDPVFLDAGANVTLAEDDGQFAWLNVYVANRTDENDIIGIAEVNGVTIDGYDIIIDGAEIGYIDRTLDLGQRSTLYINFHETATTQHVLKLLQALTYRHAGGPLGQNLEIGIELADIGQRVTPNTVTIEASGTPGTVNNAPAVDDLNGDRVTSAGTDWVRLDAGTLSTVTDDGTLRTLEVGLRNELYDSKSVFRIDTASGEVGLSWGMSSYSLVSVRNADGSMTEIGTIYGTVSGVSSFEIVFNMDATAERVTKLLQNLSYRRTDALAHPPLKWKSH